MLGTKLRSLGFRDKYFTDYAISPSLQQTFIKHLLCTRHKTGTEEIYKTPCSLTGQWGGCLELMEIPLGREDCS